MPYEHTVYVMIGLAGVAAGVASRWLSASGKIASALGLVPPIGLGLAMKFC
jgi:hypothetical protein